MGSGLAPSCAQPGHREFEEQTAFRSRDQAALGTGWTREATKQEGPT